MVLASKNGEIWLAGVRKPERGEGEGRHGG
jgi:hypothetical protein